MSFKAILFMLSGCFSASSVWGLRCGDCAADCDSPGVCETKGKCFLRRDVNGLIYRGCADGSRWNGLLYTYNGCQFQTYLGWNGEQVYWCFCDQDNCNDQELQVLQAKYGTNPLSVVKYPERGTIMSLLGQTRPTVNGPMSDFTHRDTSEEIRQPDIGQGQKNLGQGPAPGQSDTDHGQVSGIQEQGMTGIARYHMAGEKRPESRRADVQSNSNHVPDDSRVPGSPGYFRYVPSNPNFVPPDESLLSREALLDVLHRNGFDISQHRNGSNGVVLTYNPIDGNIIPYHPNKEGGENSNKPVPGERSVINRDSSTEAPKVMTTRKGAPLIPSDILNFFNRLRTSNQNKEGGSREMLHNDDFINTNGVNRDNADNYPAATNGYNTPNYVNEAINRDDITATARNRNDSTASPRHLILNQDRHVATPSVVSYNTDTSKTPSNTMESNFTLTTTTEPKIHFTRNPDKFLQNEANDSYGIVTPSVNFLDLLASINNDINDIKVNQDINITSLFAPVKARENLDLVTECPEGWLLSRRLGSCYKIERQRKSFHAAAENCTRYHQRAHLVSIETTEEYKFIVYQLKEQEKHLNGWQGWWTSGVYDPTIREFIWLDSGFVISRLNSMWHPSLLVTPFQQTCVWLVPNAGHPLGNYGCAQTSGFICELELT